jgi:hypothetical protein
MMKMVYHFSSILMQLSLPSSQVSSWSVENRDPLSEINGALNVIGEGRISPIKYQIRKNVDDLKPRTLRSLKRKASTAVQEVLDCLAPTQSKKVWQLVNENMVIFLKKKRALAF